MFVFSFFSPPQIKLLTVCSVTEIDSLNYFKIGFNMSSCFFYGSHHCPHYADEGGAAKTFSLKLQLKNCREIKHIFLQFFFFLNLVEA